MHTTQRNGTQEDTESHHRKFFIQGVTRTKQRSDLPGEHLEAKQGDQPHRNLGSHHGLQNLPDPVNVARAVVITHQGLASSGNSHHNGYNDLKHLHHDADYSHGDGHDGHLGDEAANAQWQEAPQQVAAKMEAGSFQPERLALLRQIPDSHQGCDDLTADGGQRRALHAHLQCKNGNRVQDHIHQATYQG